MTYEIITSTDYMVLKNIPVEATEDVAELTEDTAELTEDAAEHIENASESTSSANEGKYFWDYNSTLMLISFIRDRYDDTNHPAKKKIVWENIANDMVNNNVEVSSKCCIQKWKSLQRTYKHTKNYIHTKFQFIDQMEELLSSKGIDSDDEHDINRVQLKSSPGILKFRAQNKMVKMAVVAKAAYFREKCRYLNNKEKRNEKLLAQKIQIAERTAKLQEEFINLQKKNLRMFYNMYQK